MSFALFEAGQRRAPRTAARRIVWGVVTLLPLGVIAACFTVGAVLGWTGDEAVGDAELAWLTGFASGFDLLFLVTLVGGVIGVRRQHAEERAARGAGDIGAGAGRRRHRRRPGASAGSAASSER